MLAEVEEVKLKEAVVKARGSLAEHSARGNAAGSTIVMSVEVLVDEEDQVGARGVELIDASLDEVGLAWNERRWVETRQWRKP